MVHLLSVHDEFHARLIVARLGSEGILAELRTPLGSPYPMLGEVGVYVGEGDLELARDLLVADEAEADNQPADNQPADDQPADEGAARRGLGPGALVITIVAGMVMATAVLFLLL